jgi:tryptophan synthase alpha chain
MSRYEQMFARLDAAGQGAFVPFFTLGDPTPDQSLAVIETAIAAGADALELGFPFSDPVADGPTIQAATLRALAMGTTPITCFEIISRLRAKYPQLPIGILIYANLVYTNGVDAFYAKCAAAGVDSVLVADVPTLEANQCREAALKHGIAPIFIAPPNASDATLQRVANLGAGYTYLLSRAGVTGTETRAGQPISAHLNKLKALNAAPPLLGFGISEPAQVAEAIAAGAAGAIAGSSVVKVIEHNLGNPPKMCSEMSEYIRQMKAATAKA